MMRVFNPLTYRPAGDWHRARKPHVCWKCNDQIQVGERYFACLDATPSYQSGHRYHAECIVRTWPVMAREVR